jgi:hypothetical protein
MGGSMAYQRERQTPFMLALETFQRISVLISLCVLKGYSDVLRTLGIRVPCGERVS